MNPYEVIRRPLITEKTTMLSGQHNTYAFEVAREANKIEIKRAVEEIFKVDVVKVNTLNVRGKPRRRGRVVGRTPSWKKAYVTVAEGQKIDIFEQ
jgi:large subunit ribosomal protein L23